ncbi:COG1361 S-layer family protein [Methanolobus sp. WCC5]|uniref:COG1361 S-layer family protein n=1 Tax=Methanolobus sp. WCC5 TaxID=3125785 RepID=UPI0032476590
MLRKVDFKMVFSVSIVFSMLFVSPVSAAAFNMDLELPDFFNFDENYYTVYGGPDVSATLVGGNEYSRGDEVTLNINLMNKGVITGFKSESNTDPVTTLEQKIQKTEMGYEAQKTTAIGIVGILTSDNPYVRVKSGPQEAGTLASGEQTSDPLKFNIEVSKNAPAGEYTLNLTMYYGYQENVQINGDNETDLGITNMEVGLWYGVGHQVQNLKIIVKEEARFEVVNVTGELFPGKDGLISVIYKNVGEAAVKDATVRISAADPFSTTDDQSFIGSLEPGETAEAVFKLKVDANGIAKTYAINSEIKYEDMDGHSKISETVKIQTEVLPVSSSGTGTYAIIAVVLIVAVVAVIGAKKYLGSKEGDN